MHATAARKSETDYRVRQTRRQAEKEREGKGEKGMREKKRGIGMEDFGIREGNFVTIIGVGLLQSLIHCSLHTCRDL